MLSIADYEIIDTLTYFSTNPHARVGEASTVLNNPRSTIWKILLKKKWHPNFIHGLQTLKHFDYARGVDFCNWFLIQRAVKPRFSCNIQKTNECLFTEHQAINLRNVIIQTI